jgi:hypothetical protein
MDGVILRLEKLGLTSYEAKCSFALSNLYPVVFAARLGHDLKDLGLKARIVQWFDPGPPYSEGGTVLFEVKALTGD